MPTIDPKKKATFSQTTHPINLTYTLREFKNKERKISGKLVVPFEFTIPEDLSNSLMFVDSKTTMFANNYFLCAQLVPDETNATGFAEKDVSKLRCELLIHVYNQTKLDRINKEMTEEVKEKP